MKDFSSWFTCFILIYFKHGFDLVLRESLASIVWMHIFFGMCCVKVSYFVSYCPSVFLFFLLFFFIFNKAWKIL